MEQLATRDLRKLINVSSSDASPCVSVYLPVHGVSTDHEHTRRRLLRLLNKARETLLQHYPEAAATIGRSLTTLTEKLPHYLTGHSVAIFISKKINGYIPLGDDVGELAVVSKSFHVKPLLALLQGRERYIVLSLNHTKAEIYEGNRRGIKPIEAVHCSKTNGPLNQNTIRFFQDVERRLKFHFQWRQEPLLILGPEQLRSQFRRMSRWRNLVDTPVLTIGSDNPSKAQIHALTWPLASEFFRRQTKRVEREFRIARHMQATLENITDVAKAAAEGRVISLFVEKNFHIWKDLDTKEQRTADRAKKIIDPVDCALDDIAEAVITAGGDVYVLEAAAMPTRSPISAIVKRDSSTKNSA